MTMPQTDQELASVFSKGAENFKQFNSPLPGGERYTFLLKSVVLGKAKKAPNAPQIVETYRVTVGQWEGKELRVFTSLTHEVSWSICLGRWLKFGYDASAVRNLEEVEEYCEAMTAAQHLCTGLVIDDGEYKKLTVEAVSRSKGEETKKEAAPAEASAPAQPAPAAKASVPEEPADEDAPASVPSTQEISAASEEEDEGTTLGIGDTCEYTFKSIKQKGIVKEMHPANPSIGETDDKVTFLTEGKPYKVKAANIVAVTAKAPVPTKK